MEVAFLVSISLFFFNIATFAIAVLVGIWFPSWTIVQIIGTSIVLSIVLYLVTDLLDETK